VTDLARLADLYPLGQLTDEGDTWLQVRRLVKGRPRRHRAWWRGAPTKTRPEDRIAVVPQPYSPRTGRVNSVATLHADKKVTILGLVDVDEMGNPIGDTPANPATRYTTDDVAGATIVLTDNMDGTAVVAAVGPLGTAQVTATTPDPDGGPDDVYVETFNIIAGDKAGTVFRTGPEEEVTSDDAPAFR
jgi:hypothetical protein